MKRKRAYGQRKAKTPLAKKTVQIDSTLVAENDEPEGPATSMNFQPVGKSVSDEKTEKNFTSVHMETETPRTGSRQADLEIEKAVYGRMQNHPNELRKMIASIIKDMSKEAGGLANLTKTLAENSISNEQTEQPHADMDLDENNSKLHQNPEYKQQELDTALSVIKKTMKLDAADPFNRPVDPIALEIPDYFDVIDTPMDFGTICNNLENGVKYMNSGDVFKDVEYIWYNCVKYNKKGDHILELMKRVKTFFTKYWIAAGLHCEQSPTFVKPAVQQNMHNEGHSVSPVTPIADKRSTQVQSIPPSSKENRPGLSSNVQYHVPGFTNANSGVAESSISRHKKQGKDFPLVPLTNNLSNQNASGSNQIVQNQPEPINMQHPVLPQQSSNNLPQSSPEQDEPNIDSRSIQKKRQGRGPTRCVRLLNTVGRIKVLTNELGQPVGSEASQLTSFLGLTARDGNLAPLIYPSWSKVPEENKENMWQKVLMKFDIDPSSRSWVLMSLGTKWRNFKSLLKTTHYDTHSTDEERLADCDDRVLPDQWAVLVSQWSSEKWQRISAKNKANRARHKFSHTSGKKSFARIREEERAKRTDGQEPSRAELFILTRTRKNGQPVNEATAAVISQLRETDGKKNEVKDDVYERVMGVDRKGGVSLYGLNATTPSRPGPEVSTRVEALNMVAEKNAEVLQMKDKLASLEQTCSQMSAQMSQMLSMMSTLHKASPPQNIPNTVDGTLIPVGTPNQSEPTSTSIHEVPAKQTRGRKKRR